MLCPMPDVSNYHAALKNPALLVRRADFCFVVESFVPPDRANYPPLHGALRKMRIHGNLEEPSKDDRVLQFLLGEGMIMILRYRLLLTVEARLFQFRARRHC